MKTKQYICENCNNTVTDSQKFCNNCGKELYECKGKKKPYKKNLKDQDEDFIGEESGEELDIDVEEVYNSLLEENPEGVKDFFGDLNEFQNMIEGIISEGEFTSAEAIDGLMQMFYEYLEDPEGFMEELEEGEGNDSIQDRVDYTGSYKVIKDFSEEDDYGKKLVAKKGDNLEVESGGITTRVLHKGKKYSFSALNFGDFVSCLYKNDSIAYNKKTGYVMDILTKIPGISKGKAMAVMAYHGSMKNLRGMKDTKELLKYKYLRNVLSQDDAKAILEYLTGKKKLNKARISELGYDSTKLQDANEMKTYMANLKGDEQKAMIAAINRYGTGGALTAKEGRLGGFGKDYVVLCLKKAVKDTNFEYLKEAERLLKSVSKMSDSEKKIVYVCGKCGDSVSDSQKFCTGCGSQLLDV